MTKFRVKGPKVADFRVCLLHRYAYNQKTNGEIWYSQDNIIINLIETDLWNLSSFGIIQHSKLGSYYKQLTGSPVRNLFIYCCFIHCCCFNDLMVNITAATLSTQTLLPQRHASVTHGHSAGISLMMMMWGKCNFTFGKFEPSHGQVDGVKAVFVFISDCW